MHSARQALGRLVRRAVAGRIRARPLLVRRPDIWGGALIIAGTRLPVYIVVDYYHESGRSIAAVIEGWPWLTAAQVRAAVDFARHYPEEVHRDRARDLEAWAQLEAAGHSV